MTMMYFHDMIMGDGASLGLPDNQGTFGTLNGDYDRNYNFYYQ